MLLMIEKMNGFKLYVVCWEALEMQLKPMLQKGLELDGRCCRKLMLPLQKMGDV